MAAERNNKTSARQFLLGKLSEKDRSRFEEGFLADEETFEEVEIAEDELIDAYVRNELSGKDRKHVEEKLLRVPRIANRVKVARAMNRSFAPAPAVSPAVITTGWNVKLWPNSVFGKFAFATLGLILIVGGGALFFQYLQLREQTMRLRTEQAALELRVQELTVKNSENSSERNRLNADLEKERAENARLNEAVERQLDQPVTPVTILPLTLFPGASRSTSGADSLKLPATPAMFQFNLLLEADDYSSYKAVVTTAGGRELGQRSGLKARRSAKAKSVSFRFSSTRFKPGDYVVNLSGVTASVQSDPIATYMFQVVP